MMNTVCADQLYCISKGTTTRQANDQNLQGTTTTWKLNMDM